MRAGAILKFIIESFAGFFSGIVLLSTVLVGLAAFDRLNIDFLTEELERTFNESGLPFEVDIASTNLVWGGWQEALEIQTNNVILYDMHQREVLSFDKLLLDLNVMALLKGEVIPTRLDVDGGRLILRRLQDGRYDFIKLLSDSETIIRQKQLEAQRKNRQMVRVELEEPILGNKRDIYSQTFEHLLDSFALIETTAYDSYIFKDLADFNVRNYKIEIEDIQNYRKFSLNNANFVLYQEEADTVVALDGILEADGLTSLVSIQILHPVASERISLDFAASDFSTRNLKDFFPDLENHLKLQSNMDLVFSGDVYPKVIEDENNRKSYHLDLESVLSTPDISIAIQGRLKDWGEDTEILIETNQFDLALLPEFSPHLDLELPIAGEIEAKAFFETNLYQLERFPDADMYLSIFDGQLNLPHLYNEPKQFKQISSHISLKDNMTMLEVKDTALAFADVTLNLESQILNIEPNRQQKDQQKLLEQIQYKFAQDYAVDLKVDLSDFDIAKLKKYWPAAVGEDARKWILENINAGQIPYANVHLQAEFNPKNKNFSLDKLDGKIEINNADVHYFRPLPPAKNTTGTAVFGKNWFDIDIFSAEVENLTAKGGNIYISDIGVTDFINIDLDITGPAQNALSLLDRNPLKLISKMGAAFDYPTGTVEANLQFDFELLNDLNIEDVAIEAVADIKNASVFIPGIRKRVSSEHLDLDLTHDEMLLSGDVQVDNNIFQASWYEGFSEKTDIERQYEISGNLTTDFIQRQGVDLTDFVMGEGNFNVNFQQLRAQPTQIISYVDLSDTALSYTPLELLKPLGEEGNLYLKAQLDNELNINLTEFEIISDALKVVGTGNVQLATDERDNQLEFNIHEIKADKTDVAVALNAYGRSLSDLNLSVDVRGKELNIAHFADVSSKENSDIEKQKTLNTDDKVLSKGVLNIELDVDKLFVIEEQNLYGTKIKFRQKEGSIDMLHSSLHTSNGKEVTIKYGDNVQNDIMPEQQGKRLVAEISDWGMLLTDLGLTEKIVAGDGKFQGIYMSSDAFFKGELQLADYELKDAPVLAKLISALSITGLPGALSGGNMNFNQLTARLEIQDDILKLEKAIANNTSIGLSLSGDLDLNSMHFDGQGTVIPAYGFNQLIGNVPLLGWILTGGEGGGLLGAVFYLTGPLQNLDVNVNPASIFTPGVLRRFFDVNQSNPNNSNQENNDRR